jgi:hypothetical protein
MAISNASSMLVAFLLCNPQNTPISNKFKHNIYFSILDCLQIPQHCIQNEMF